jgi:hypothetical protein
MPYPRGGGGAHTTFSFFFQVANDSLSLRRPVHNTCLTFLSTPQLIVAGTLHGDVRRYDMRVAQKPVAEWTQIAKGNGIGCVEKGFHEQLRHSSLFSTISVDFPDNATPPASYSSLTRRATYSPWMCVTGVSPTDTKVPSPLFFPYRAIAACADFCVKAPRELSPP